MMDIIIPSQLSSLSVHLPQGLAHQWRLADLVEDGVEDHCGVCVCGCMSACVLRMDCSGMDVVQVLRVYCSSWVVAEATAAAARTRTDGILIITPSSLLALALVTVTLPLCLLTRPNTGHADRET